MLIDFNKIAEVEVENFNGGEKSVLMRTFKDDSNRTLMGIIKKGCSVGMHTHSDSCEFVYILSGEGKSICDGVEEVLTKGMLHYCPKGSSHNMFNEKDEDFVMLAIVPKQ